MLKMQIPVVVSSVKVAKDATSKNYADFLFTGGSISVAVEDTHFQSLKSKEGLEILALFELRPVQVVRFGRPASVFEIARFIEIAK